MNEAVISTNLLCKSFLTDGEMNHVIKNMNIEVMRNDFTVIMGSSGSGKSTLLYLLSGMDQVTSGDVFFNEMNLSKLPEKKMYRFRKDKIGFVFQGINLIPDLTIVENVLSPAYQSNQGKEEVADRAEELINKMGLTEHKRKFPSQLSGGQRQRAAICRALINQPDIIFADEPTGALNSAQGENVLDLFSEMHQEGQTVVMVTHDLKAALRGNRIIYIKDGRIDGDLRLEPFDKNTMEEREKCLYEFLKERGW